MMRCTFCNVDLEDTGKTCPLCGKPAADEKPHVVRIANPYPTIEISPLKSARKTDV
ncbi:MAG: hypothetical protein GXZ02_04460 [Clostridiales bacterium]|nr:hypothetical protein [Clostridiales bacterium]